MYLCMVCERTQSFPGNCQKCQRPVISRPTTGMLGLPKPSKRPKYSHENSPNIMRQSPPFVTGYPNSPYKPSISNVSRLNSGLSTPQSNQRPIKRKTKKSSFYQVASDDKQGKTIKSVKSGEIDADLFKFRKQFKDSKHPEQIAAAGLIGLPSSSYHNYTQRTPLFRFDNSEMYHRSSTHPLASYLGNDMPITAPFKLNIEYGEYDLAEKGSFEISPFEGGDIYFGNFQNSIQALGDRSITGSQTNKKTVKGDSALFNLIQRYKNETCRNIVDHYKSAAYDDNYIVVGHYNNYPNVMIYINEQQITSKLSIGSVSEDSFKNFVDCLISCFLGLLNYRANSEKMPIELVRRSSFGFSVPTISPTGPSIRLSVGIIPNEYQIIIGNCLAEFSQIFANIFDKQNTYSFKTGIYNTEQHIKYLKSGRKEITPTEVKDIIQLLFAPGDKRGRTIGTNLVRTALARDAMASKVSNHLAQNKDANATSAFIEGISWAVEQLALAKGVLSFNQKDVKVQYNNFSLTDSKQLSDEDNNQFWQIIAHLIRALKAKKIFNSPLSALESALEKKIISVNFYYELTKLIELIFVDAIDEFPNIKNGNMEDGYGSDSDVEGDVEERSIQSGASNKIRIYANKLITHNGMYVIWGTLKAACEYTGVLINRVFFDNSYYEIVKGFPLLTDARNSNKRKKLSVSVNKKLPADIPSDSPVNLDFVPDYNGFLGLNAYKGLNVSATLNPSARKKKRKLDEIDGDDELSDSEVDENENSENEEAPSKVTGTGNKNNHSLLISINRAAFIKNVERTEEIKQANIILHDINHCVIDSKESKLNAQIQEMLITKGHAAKILILDTTSATTEQGYAWLQYFAASSLDIALFVSSGVKHEQMGGDKNQYGTVRIFAKNKELRNKMYNLIKQNTNPILSMISHTHRRIMKSIGAVPVNSQYLNSTQDQFTGDSTSVGNTNFLSSDIHLTAIKAIKDIIPRIGDSSQTAVATQQNLFSYLSGIEHKLTKQPDDKKALSDLKELQEKLGLSSKSEQASISQPAVRSFNYNDYMPQHTNNKNLFHTVNSGFMIGYAPATNNDCLIYSLIQLTYTYLSPQKKMELWDLKINNYDLDKVDNLAAQIRGVLVQEGLTQYGAFLFTYYHAGRILELLGLNPNLFIVKTYASYKGIGGVDAIQEDEPVGNNGSTPLFLWNTGIHYEPIWRRN